MSMGIGMGLNMNMMCCMGMVMTLGSRYMMKEMCRANRWVLVVLSKRCRCESNLRGLQYLAVMWVSCEGHAKEV